jgi:hypothetical protein
MCPARAVLDERRTTSRRAPRAFFSRPARE